MIGGTIRGKKKENKVGKLERKKKKGPSSIEGKGLWRHGEKGAKRRGKWIVTPHREGVLAPQRIEALG